MKTVAIIGCGKAVEGKEGWAVGHNHANGYKETGKELKLMGVDLSPENLAAFGEKFQLPAEQLFASTDALYAAGVPDVVSICTWPKLHYPMVMEALEKGVKAIACEKPFTMDIGELREIEAKVKEKSAVLVVCHQRRRNQGFRKLKEVALSGKLGDNIHVECVVGDDWDILSWTTHWFDMANFIFEGAPEWLMAGMDINTTRRYDHAVEDASSIYAYYDKNRSAHFLTGPGKSFGVRIIGDKGIVRIKGADIECATFDGVEKIEIPKGLGDYAAMFTEMLDALDGGAKPLCSIIYCAAATEMAYAAHESASTGKKVSLPLSTQYAPLEVVQRPIRSGLAGKKILLYADNHFGSGGCEGVADAFTEATRKEVRVLDAEKVGLSATDVADVDAILIYHTQKEVSEQTKAVLRAWVSAGKPLLIVHAGLGAWPEWDEYLGWCGLIWEWGVSVHPYESTVLKVSEGDVLALGWSEAWLPKDEVFVKLKETASIKVGLTSDISTGTFAAAWQHGDLPHVGGWMPGHRRDSWNVPAMREGAVRTLLALFS